MGSAHHSLAGATWQGQGRAGQGIIGCVEQRMVGLWFGLPHRLLFPQSVSISLLSCPPETKSSPLHALYGSSAWSRLMREQWSSAWLSFLVHRQRYGTPPFPLIPHTPEGKSSPAPIERTASIFERPTLARRPPLTGSWEPEHSLAYRSGSPRSSRSSPPLALPWVVRSLSSLIFL